MLSYVNFTLSHQVALLHDPGGEELLLVHSRKGPGVQFNRHFRDIPKPVPNHVKSFQTCLNLQFHVPWCWIVFRFVPISHPIPQMSVELPPCTPMRMMPRWRWRWGWRGWRWGWATPSPATGCPSAASSGTSLLQRKKINTRSYIVQNMVSWTTPHVGIYPRAQQNMQRVQSRDWFNFPAGQPVSLRRI